MSTPVPEVVNDEDRVSLHAQPEDLLDILLTTPTGEGPPGEGIVELPRQLVVPGPDTTRPDEAELKAETEPAPGLGKACKWCLRGRAPSKAHTRVLTLNQDPN